MTSGGAQYWTSGAIPLIAPEILGDIISSVADLSLVISDRGEVLSVLINPESDGFDALKSICGQNIRGVLTTESIEKFDTRISDFLARKPIPAGTELNHVGAQGAWDFPIRYSFHRIGPDGAILMLGRDLRPVAEMQQQLVEAQQVLERDYEAQRESDTRLRVMMDATSEPMLFVSLTSGKITDANRAAADLLGAERDDLTGRALKAELGGLSSDPVDMLTAHVIAERPGPASVTLRRGKTTVDVTPLLFRAAGERLMLCRFALPGAEPAADIDSIQNLRGLFDQGPDAIAFTDAAGRLLSVNDSFLNLIDSAQETGIKGTNLSDYLSRGSVDLKVMLENAGRNGKMRIFPTKLCSPFGSSRPVEISVTSLTAGDTQAFSFIFRDTSRIEQVRPVNTPVTDDNVQSVMELVGSASLKEIVAETTTVVERMCIETAVELTMNNRVAAAEMLGLSRQSLYVKLRKYGLINRDEAD